MWKKTAFQIGLLALDYGLKKRKRKTNKRSGKTKRGGKRG